jgi:hypothetical protein
MGHGLAQINTDKEFNSVFPCSSVSEIRQLDYTRFWDIGQEQVFDIANEADVWYTQHESRITDHELRERARD